MMPNWRSGGATLALLTLIACGQAGANPPASAALPTADIAVPAPGQVQIIPLTPTAAIATAEPQTLSPAASQPISSGTTVAAGTEQPPASVTPAELAGQSSDPTPPDAASATLEAQLIVEINRVRVSNQLPPYEASPDLGAAARAHSCDLAAHHLISHASSDGRSLAERLAGSTPPWEWPSESIAAGTPDPATVVAWWMDEPPDGWHRRNILDEQQQAVGAGYCFAEEDPSGNHSYWTADFARRSPSP